MLILDREHNAAINVLKRAVGTTVQACGAEPLGLVWKQEATESLAQW
jgi:putative transposase